MDAITKALQTIRSALVEQGFIVLSHDPLHLLDDETGEEILITITHRASWETIAKRNALDHLE